MCVTGLHDKHAILRLYHILLLNQRVGHSVSENTYSNRHAEVQHLTE